MKCLPIGDFGGRLLKKCWLHSGILVLAILAAGCGDTGMQQVTGKVQLDGAPVEEGRINFIMKDTKEAFGAPIKAGQYQIETKPGTMTVEITATRIIPGKFDEESNPGFKEPVGEQYIPAKYNTNTELVAEVSSSNLTHSFDLKSN